MSYKFSPGDLITGLDQSFLRSIYRFDGILPNGCAKVTHVSFNGSVRGDKLSWPTEKLNDYRKATQSEVYRSLVGERHWVEDPNPFNKLFEALSYAEPTHFWAYDGLQFISDGFEVRAFGVDLNETQPPTKLCECGKDKHGFARHLTWCKAYE